MKERKRLVHKVGIKILAQVILDVPRHPDQDAALQKQEGAADCAGSEDFQRSDCELGPANRGPVFINGAADD